MIGDLERTQVLDDARYAERFADDHRTLKGWGADRIEQDLARRGISQELIATALAGWTREDELAAACYLLAQRFTAFDDDRERNRAWQLLVRRGFDAELAYDAVRAHGRAAPELASSGPESYPEDQRATRPQ